MWSVQFIQFAGCGDTEILCHVSNCTVYFLSDQAGYFDRFVAKTELLYLFFKLLSIHFLIC